MLRSGYLNCAAQHLWIETFGKSPWRDILVIGASAGGIEALQQLLKGLPDDLDACILVVLHTSGHADSLLSQIMQRAGKLPVPHRRGRSPNTRLFLSRSFGRQSFLSLPALTGR